MTRYGKYSSVFRLEGLGLVFRVGGQGYRFWVWGSGFKVSGPGVKDHFLNLGPERLKAQRRRRRGRRRRKKI